MKNTSNYLLIIFSFLFCFSACTHKVTLQSYFVDHQEAPAFMSMDIPVSFLNPDKIDLSEDQKNAIESIDKLNMIAYNLVDGNLEEFKSELAVVKEILKLNVYNDLMRMSTSSDGKLQILYIENRSVIDEIIILGYSTDIGFAIIRVLGDDMNLSKILKLGDVINQFDTNHSNVDSFMKYLL